MQGMHPSRTLVLVVLCGLSASQMACTRTPEPEPEVRLRAPEPLSGDYVNETGVLHFHFSGGRVRMTGGIADFETDYEVIGDQLWITTANKERKAMTIREDGALVGELGVFVRKR